MSRRPRHSLVPSPPPANMERLPACASGPTTDVNQDPSQSLRKCSNGAHSDTLSYRAVAARAVGGCSNSSLAVPSAQVMVSQPVAGNSDRDAESSVSPTGDTGDPAPLSAASSCLPGDCSRAEHPSCASASSGTGTCSRARGNISISSTLPAATADTSTPWQAPLKNQFTWRDSGVLRQPKEQIVGRRVGNWKVLNNHLAAVADNGASEPRRPGSPSASHCLPAPVDATQDRGQSQGEKSATVATEGTTELQESTTRKDDSSTVTKAVTTSLLKERQPKGILCRRKTRQQQQTSAHMSHKQQLCTEQQRPQHDSTHKLHPAQQQLAQQQPQSQDLSMQQQKDLKQHLPTPLRMNDEQTSSLEDATAEELTAVASSNSEFTDPPGETDNGSPCSSAKGELLQGKQRSEFKEQRIGGGARQCNKSTAGNANEVAHAARSGDSGCRPMGSGYTSQGENATGRHQRQGEKSSSSSSTARGSGNSSSISSGSSSIIGGSSNSSVSSTCSTSSSRACGSSEDSGSAGISNGSDLIKPYSGDSSSTSAGTDAVATPGTSSGYTGNSAAAVTVLYPQQASCTKTLQPGTTAQSSGINKAKSPRDCSSTCQQSRCTTDHLPRSKRNSYCARKHHDSGQHKADPLFQKEEIDNHEGAPVPRRASASGKVRPRTHNSSSSGCSTARRVARSGRIIAGSPADVDAATRPIGNHLGSAAENLAGSAGGALPQPAAEADKASAGKTGAISTTASTAGQSAAGDTVADLTDQQERECMRSRHSTRSRRGRSIPRACPMVRGKMHRPGMIALGVSPAPTALHNRAASKATAPRDAHPAASNKTDSSGASIVNIGFCSAASACAARAVAVAPGASDDGSVAVTCPAVNNSPPWAEPSLNPMESELLNNLGTNSAADMKRISGSKKNKPIYRLMKPGSYQHTASHQPHVATASAVTPSGASSAAGTKGNSENPQAEKLLQIICADPEAVSPGASEAVETAKCKRAGATRAAPPSTARGAVVSALIPSVFHPGNINRKPTTKSASAADTPTPNDASRTNSATTPATSVANTSTEEAGAARISTTPGTVETNAPVKDQVPALHAASVHTENPGIPCGTDKRGAVNSLKNPVCVSRSPRACAEGASACTAAADSASSDTLKETTISGGVPDGSVAAASLPTKGSTGGPVSAEDDSSGGVCVEQVGAAAGSLDNLKEEDVEEAQFSTLATPGVERISVLLPDGSLNLRFFKVFPCRNRNAQHEKRGCPYYHNSRDRRRAPVTYRAEQCEEHFDLDAVPVQCSKGEACGKSHNRHELLYHPHIYKQRFCSSLPCILPFKSNDDEHGSHPNARKKTPCCASSVKAGGCARGVYCAFAHSREEIRATLFSEEEERNPDSRFFVNKFKTIWCPYGSQHDWRTCVYAHTYQDCRRSPLIGYGSEPCAAWNKDLHSADYEKRCPHGARCSYSHGSKEQLYHPSYYKTMPCIDYRPATAAGSHSRSRGNVQQQHVTSRNVSSSDTSAVFEAGGCPRGFLCAFYHDGRERRVPTPPSPQFTYAAPLPASQLKLLQPLFLKPPLFNLDDFEAFGHTSRQTAALRRSQAISNGQSAGNAITSKPRMDGTPAVEAVKTTLFRYEVTLCPRSSTKVQYRSNYMHKSGSTASSSRFRELGMLTSPQQTKWLSNSNPLDRRPAEGLKTCCLPVPAGSAFAGAPAVVSAATGRARSAGTVARATGRKDSVDATCAAAGLSGFAAKAVDAVVLFEDTVKPQTKEEQPSAEKPATCADACVISSTHSLKRARVCGSDSAEKEATTEATNEKEVDVLGATVKQQLQYKLQGNARDGGAQRGPEHQRKRQTLHNQGQHNPQSEHVPQSNNVQPRRQGQPQQVTHDSHVQEKETLGNSINESLPIENPHRDLQNTAAVEQAITQQESTTEECIQLKTAPVITDSEPSALSAASKAMNRGTELLTVCKTEEEASSNEEVAVPEGAAAAKMSSSMKSPVGLVTEVYEVAATVTPAEGDINRNQHNRVLRQVDALVLERSASAHTCGGSHQAAFSQQDVRKKIDNIRQGAILTYFSTPEQNNSTQCFKPPLEPEGWNVEHLPEKWQPQFEASTQERQGSREELQQFPQQQLGQHEQGLHQGYDLLVAAVSNISNHESLSPPCSWHPHLLGNPRSTCDSQSVVGVADCTQESRDAEAVSISDKLGSGMLVPVTRSPARTRAAATSRVSEGGVFLQKASKGELTFVGLHEGDNARGKEVLREVSGNGKSANGSCENLRDRSSERIEGRRIFRNAFFPSCSLRPGKVAAGQRILASSGTSQEHLFWLGQQRPGDELDSVLAGGKNVLWNTWFETSNTSKQGIKQRLLSHDHLGDVGEPVPTRCSYLTQQNTNSVSGLTGHNIGDCLSGSNTKDVNCSTNSSSINSSSSTSSSSSSSSGRRIGSSDGSGHTGSGRTESRSNCTTGRRFVGLFNNGRVWQVPPSGNIGESRGSLWWNAASGSKVLNSSSEEHGTSEERCSFTSYSLETSNVYAGCSTGMGETAAGGGYSLWVTPPDCTVEYAFPASSPACSATGQTSCAAAVGVVEGEHSKDSSLRRCYTSQRLTVPPSQCCSFQQLLREEACADAQKLESLGAHPDEAAASVADIQAAPSERSANAPTKRNQPVTASIPAAHFTAENATAAPCVTGAAAHLDEKLVAGTCKESPRMWWRRNAGNRAPGSASQLLHQSLQTSVAEFQEQLPSLYQLQQSLSSQAFGGTRGSFGIACSNGGYDTHNETGAKETEGIETAREAALPRPGELPLATTTAPMEKAPAVRALECDTCTMQNSAPWKATSMFTSEERICKSLNTGIAALPCLGVDNTSNWSESVCNSSSIYSASHKKCVSDEHGERGGATYSNGTNCHSGNSNDEIGGIGDGVIRYQCNNYSHTLYDSLVPLSGGREPIWGNAFCGARVALAQEAIHRECFASSAPPRLCSLTAHTVQQEQQQHELQPEELSHLQQHCREQSYIFPSHLLRPRLQPDQEGYAVHEHFCRAQGKQRYQSPTGPLKPVECSTTGYNVEQRYQQVLGWCQSSQKYESGSSSARSQSEEAAAAAAAAVLNLLDDDERLEQLPQEERTSDCFASAARNSVDCCPSLAKSTELRTKVVDLAIGTAVAERATAGTAGSPAGNGTLLPAWTPFTTEAVSKAALLPSQAPLSLTSGESCRVSNECVPLTDDARTRVPTVPPEAAEQHCSTHENSNNVFSTGGASAGATLAGAAAAGGSGTTTGHESKISTDNNPDVLCAYTGVAADPGNRIDHAPGVLSSAVRPKIILGGPLVIGAATAVEQQQLMLLLLRSQLWEKIFLIVHPTASGFPKDTYSKVEEQNMQSAYRTCNGARVSTRDEARGGVQAPVGATYVAGAGDGERSHPVVQTGGPDEEVERKARAPTRVDVAGTSGKTSRGSFRGGNVPASTAETLVWAPENDEGTPMEEIPAIEEEVATIVETARNADYTCETGFNEEGGLQVVGTGVLRELKSIGLDVGQQPQLQPKVPRVLSNRLLVLTQSPHHRVQQHPYKSEKQAEKRLRQSQQRSQSAMQQRQGQQHLKRQEKKVAEERDSSTLPVAFSCSTGRPVLAVFFLHRSPLELNKWLCQLRQQRQHQEDGSSSAHSSTNPESNETSGDCGINSSTSSSVSRSQSTVGLSASDGEVEEATQTQAAILTNVTGAATAHQRGTAVLPPDKAVSTDSQLKAVEIPTPLTGAATVDTTAQSAAAVVREQEHSCTRTPTATLLHVAVLHIVCNCQSSLDLLSQLSPHQQERCVFPQAHALPLWSRFLHGGWSSHGHRRGRSTTNRNRIASCCASNISSITSCNSAESKIATSSFRLAAAFTSRPSSPSSSPFNVASVPSETPSVATSKLHTRDFVVAGSSSGMKVLCPSKSNWSDSCNSNVGAKPQRRNSIALSITQTQSSSKESQVLHTGASALEGPAARPVLVEAAAEETTRAPITSRLFGGPAYPSALNIKTTKLLGRHGDATFPAPSAVSKVYMRSSRTRGSHGSSLMLERSSVSLSASTEVWGCLDDGAPHDIKSMTSSSYTSESLPTSSNGYKQRSTSCSYTTDCSNSDVVWNDWKTAPFMGSSSGSDSGSLGKHRSKDSPRKAAGDVVSQVMRAHHAGERAGKDKRSLALLLLEELREAKGAAASLLQTQRPTEVLLCVCCRYGRNAHSLRQHSLTLPFLRGIVHSAGTLQNKKRARPDRIGDVAAATDNDDRTKRGDVIQGSPFLDRGTDISRKHHRSVSPRPRRQAHRALKERLLTQQCRTTSFISPEKHQECQVHLFPLKKHITDKGSDFRHSCSGNSSGSRQQRSELSSPAKSVKSSASSFLLSKTLVDRPSPEARFVSSPKRNLRTHRDGTLPTEVSTTAEGITTTTVIGKLSVDGPAEMRVPPTAVATFTGAVPQASMASAAAPPAEAANAIHLRSEVAERDDEGRRAAQLMELPHIVSGEAAESGCITTAAKGYPFQERRQHSRRCLHQSPCSKNSACVPLPVEETAAVTDVTTSCTVAYPKLCTINLQQLVIGCLREELISLPLLHLLLQAPFRSAPEQQQWIAAIPRGAFRGPLADGDGSRIRNGMHQGIAVDDEKVSYEGNKAHCTDLFIGDRLFRGNEASGSVKGGYSSTSCNISACQDVICYEELWCVLCGNSAAAVPRSAFTHSRNGRTSSNRWDTMNNSTTTCGNSSSHRSKSSEKGPTDRTTRTPPMTMATMCCLVRRKLNRCRKANSLNTNKEAVMMGTEENKRSHMNKAAQCRKSNVELDISMLELVCPHAFHLHCVEDVLLPVLRGRCICQFFVPPPHWLQSRSHDATIRRDNAGSDSSWGCSCRLYVSGSRCGGSTPKGFRTGTVYRAHTRLKRSSSDGSRRLMRVNSSCDCRGSRRNCCIRNASASPEEFDGGLGTADLTHPCCSQASQSTAYSNSERKASTENRVDRNGANGSGDSNALKENRDYQNIRCNVNPSGGGESISTLTHLHVSAESFLQPAGKNVRPDSPQCRSAPSPVERAASVTKISETSGVLCAAKNLFEQPFSTAGTARDSHGLPCGSEGFHSVLASSAFAAIGSVAGDSTGLTLGSSVVSRDPGHATRPAASGLSPVYQRRYSCCETSKFLSAGRPGATLPPSTFSKNESSIPQPVEHPTTGYESQKRSVPSEDSCLRLTATATLTVPAVPSLTSASSTCNLQNGPSSLPPGLPNLLATTLEAFARLQQLHAMFLLKEPHLRKGEEKPTKLAQQPQQSLGRSTGEIFISKEQNGACDIVQRSPQRLHEVENYSRKTDFRNYKGQSSRCSRCSREADDNNNEKGSSRNKSPSTRKGTSCARSIYCGKLERNASYVIFREDNEGSDTSSRKGSSRLIATHRWGVPPDRLQLVFPLVSSAASCSSVKVFLQPIVAAWRDTLLLECGNLSCYGTAAARIMLFVLQGRQDGWTFKDVCCCHTRKIEHVNAFAKNPKKGMRDTPSSACLPGKCIKRRYSSCLITGDTSSKSSHGNSRKSSISATDVVACRSRRGDGFKCYEWSRPSRSNRTPQASSANGCPDRVAAHRSVQNNAYAVYASEDLPATSGLNEDERAAAEAYPPLLRHLLLLLDESGRYCNQDEERVGSWRRRCGSAKLKSVGAHACGTGPGGAMLHVEENVKEKYSGSRKSATERNAFLAAASSTFIADVEAAITEESFEPPQTVESVLSTTNSITLGACVQHPFFWDASERMDLLDCCATFFNLQAGSITCSKAVAKVATRSGEGSVATAALDLRSREKKAGPVTKAIAVAERMAANWRGRLDVLLLPAVGEAGLPERNSNVESLLDFLRILRFEWNSWILKLPDEQLESLAQQYAAPPLPDGVESHGFLGFWSAEKARSSVNPIQATGSSEVALSKAVKQGKTSQADTTVERGRTLVSAVEKHKYVEPKGFDKRSITVTAKADTEEKRPAGEASLHTCMSGASRASIATTHFVVAPDPPDSGSSCRVNDYAYKNKEERDPHKLQPESQQRSFQLLEAEQNRNTPVNGVVEDLICGHHLEVPCNRNRGDPAQLKKRRRLLRKKLIESRDGALIQQLDCIHPELFLLFCVIAGSSDPSSVNGSCYSHDFHNEASDSISRQDSDVEEAYQVSPYTGWEGMLVELQWEERTVAGALRFIIHRNDLLACNVFECLTAETCYVEG